MSVLLATSCSATAGVEAERGAVEEEAVSVAVEAEPGAVEEEAAESVALEMLSLVPYESDISGLLRFVNMDLAFETAGYDLEAICEADDPGLYEEAFIQAVQRRTSLPDVPFLVGVADGWDLFPQSFGTEYCGLNAVMQTQGVQSVVIWQTDEPASEILERAAANPEWLSELVRTEVGPYQVLDWGSETDISRRDSVRNLGRGGQLAAVEDLVLRTISSLSMDRVINPDHPRMIDRPFVRSTVELLEGEGAYAFFLDTPVFGDAPFQYGVADIDEIRESVEVPGGLAPWFQLGYGTALDTDGSDIGVVVLGHVNEDDAAANVERLRTVMETGELKGRPVSGLVNVLDIRSEGSYTIARIASPVDDGTSLRQLSGLVYQLLVFTSGS